MLAPWLLGTGARGHGGSARNAPGFPAHRRRNIGLLVRFMAILAVMIVAYSIFFHVIMEYEGQWASGISPSIRIWGGSSPCSCS